MTGPRDENVIYTTPGSETSWVDLLFNAGKTATGRAPSEPEIQFLKPSAVSKSEAAIYEARQRHVQKAFHVPGRQTGRRALVECDFQQIEDRAMALYARDSFRKKHPGVLDAYTAAVAETTLKDAISSLLDDILPKPAPAPSSISVEDLRRAAGFKQPVAAHPKNSVWWPASTQYLATRKTHDIFA